MVFGVLQSKKLALVNKVTQVGDGVDEGWGDSGYVPLAVVTGDTSDMPPPSRSYLTTPIKVFLKSQERSRRLVGNSHSRVSLGEQTLNSAFNSGSESEEEEEEEGSRQWPWGGDEGLFVPGNGSETFNGTDAGEPSMDIEGGDEEPGEGGSVASEDEGTLDLSAAGRGGANSLNRSNDDERMAVDDEEGEPTPTLYSAHDRLAEERAKAWEAEVEALMKRYSGGHRFMKSMADGGSYDGKADNTEDVKAGHERLFKMIDDAAGDRAKPLVMIESDLQEVMVTITTQLTPHHPTPPHRQPVSSINPMTRLCHVQFHLIQNDLDARRVRIQAEITRLKKWLGQNPRALARLVCACACACVRVRVRMRMRVCVPPALPALNPLSHRVSLKTATKVALNNAESEMGELERRTKHLLGLFHALVRFPLTHIANFRIISLI